MTSRSASGSRADRRPEYSTEQRATMRRTAAEATVRPGWSAVRRLLGARRQALGRDGRRLALVDRQDLDRADALRPGHQEPQLRARAERLADQRCEADRPVLAADHQRPLDRAGLVPLLDLVHQHAGAG